MLFDSLAFLIAFPLFSALFFVAPARWQPGLALLGSIAACASFGWVTVFWLAVVTFGGYLFGRVLSNGASSLKLAGAIVLIVAPLAVVKYTNFALGSLQSFLAAFGMHTAMPHFDFALPIGISFYTFVVLGYLIDVYVERIEPERSLLRFALFTSFYPKFIAGPVERAANFIPQIAVAKRFDYARVTDGIRIIAGGLFKKLVVADRLAVAVNGVYADPAAFGGLTLALTAIFYMFQLYYDFWGYSEMAVGAARVLGFDITWNFNRPYAARSISEYWRRWHISLTTWFFEYIFAPVAAALRDWRSAAVFVAMMTTFLVSGLWHGAQWTFVIYGLLHGAALSVHYLSAPLRKNLWTWVPARLYAVLAWVVTFAFVGCTDVVFRSVSIRQAGLFLGRMLTGTPADLRFLNEHHFNAASVKALIAGFPIAKFDLVVAMVALVCVEVVAWRSKQRPFREQLLDQPIWQRWSVYYVVVGSILYLGSQNAATLFIYMRF
jgi:alginate O-acetyltransferase complex protein AlgI